MTKAEIQQVKLRFGIIGNNEALMRAIDVAIQVAPTDLSVLITGESGVGKESFPQIIHQYSRRKHGQYIAVNCVPFPKEPLTRNYSVTRKEPLLVPSVSGKDTLVRRMVEQSSWMKWENCLYLRRLDCSGCSRVESF